MLSLLTSLKHLINQQYYLIIVIIALSLCFPTVFIALRAQNIALASFP